MPPPSSKPTQVGEPEKVTSKPKRQRFAATTPVKAATAAGIPKPVHSPATAAVSSKPQPPVGGRIELAVNKQREPDGTYGFLPVVVEEGVCISLGGSFVKATVVPRTSEEQLARPFVFRVKVDDATATQDVQRSDHWRPLVVHGDLSPPTIPAPTDTAQFASNAGKPRWPVRVYGNSQFSMWLYYATRTADGAEVWWAARFQQGDLVSAPKGLFNDWPEEVLQKARALCVAARDQYKGLLRKEKESAAALAKMADDSAGSQLPPPPGARIYLRVRPDVPEAMSADMSAENMSAGEDEDETIAECVKNVRATRSWAPVDISASVTFAQGKPPVWETTTQLDEWKQATVLPTTDGADAAPPGCFLVQYQDGAAAVAVSVTAQWIPCPTSTSMPGLEPLTDIRQSSVEAGKLRWPEVRRYERPRDDGSVRADYYVFYKTEVTTASGASREVLWARRHVLRRVAKKGAKSEPDAPRDKALHAACDAKVKARKSAEVVVGRRGLLSRGNARKFRARPHPSPEPARWPACDFGR
jgi:hypothetical protein